MTKTTILRIINVLFWGGLGFMLNNIPSYLNLPRSEWTTTIVVVLGMLVDWSLRRRKDKAKQ
jgi:hypothetical protein